MFWNCSFQSLQSPYMVYILYGIARGPLFCGLIPEHSMCFPFSSEGQAFGLQSKSRVTAPRGSPFTYDYVADVALLKVLEFLKKHCEIMIVQVIVTYCSGM